MKCLHSSAYGIFEYENLLTLFCFFQFILYFYKCVAIREMIKIMLQT